MKSASKQKRIKRATRHKRVRAKVFGTSEMPRLCVFRSGKHIYAQIIDDENGKTLVSASTLKLNLSAGKPAKAGLRAKKVDASKEVGKSVAEQALARKISRVVFDRGGYKYHGRIKALAEGAREGGLKF